MRGTWWVRPLILVALVAGGIVVALTVGIPPIGDIRAWVDRAGWAAPVLYAVAYAALTLTPAPATVTTITAGVLFGLPVGLVVALTGAVAGSAIGFALGRLLGRGAVSRIDHRRLRRLDALLERRGLIAVIGVRLVPMLPFAALNYACGLTAVRPRDYLLGTAVGILPGATAFVTIGAFGATPGSLSFVLGLVGLVVLAVGGMVVMARSRAATEQPAG